MTDHHHFKPGEWPFRDAVNLGVLATVQVMEGAPVLFASHDEDDGGWQFLHSPDLTDDDVGDLRYVCFGCLFERHREVAALADLPLGWQAERDGAAAPWRRSLSPPEL